LWDEHFPFSIFQDSFKSIMRWFVLGFVCLWVEGCTLQSFYSQSVSHKSLLLLKRAEKVHGIPPYLLCAVAVVESGTRSHQHAPWPWTLTVRGKSHFFKNKEKALKSLRAFLNKGIHNIDIGLMQLNFRAHRRAFPNLEKALDPEWNIGYAAYFLTHLYRRSDKSWVQAVAHYHSRKPEHHLTYQRKVIRAWHALRGRQKDLFETKGPQEEKTQAMVPAKRNVIKRIPPRKPSHWTFYAPRSHSQAFLSWQKPPPAPIPPGYFC
jgi:hypothetical protein